VGAGAQAAHGHVAGEFGLELFEDLLDAAGAVGGEAPKDGAADEDRFGAEGEGFQDVAAAAEAAVDEEGDFVVYFGGDGGEDFDGTGFGLAVVGDDDAVDAVVDGLFRGGWR
jgi:hypothetical protein